ncbi:hypothetical protein LguiA_031041 [Lonicera macranthoides]
MDKSLYNAAITGNIEVILGQTKDQSADKVLQLRTPNWSTILHLASQFGHTEAVQAILSAYPSLINEVNSSRDSALHLAARGGHTDVVRALIDYAKMLDQDIETGMRDKRLGVLRCRNKNDDTALHEATRYNHIQVLSMLLEEDDQSSAKYRNKSGETLLYLAASRGFHDLVDAIVKACRDPDYRGPNGKTALHGAAICNNRDCTRKLLEWRKALIRYEDGSSNLPLDYAAHLGFAKVVNELLRADESIGYIADRDDKNTALFIAASAGHISVMKELISHCPSCWHMVNAKERNVLHIAIEHEQKNVIEYLLEECPMIISSLIIEKDIDGNTPLHLLATSDCFVPKLIQHPMADKGALNNKGFTPLDLVIYVDDKSSTTTAKGKIAGELKNVGAVQNSRIAPTPAHAPTLAPPPPPPPPPSVLSKDSRIDDLKKMTDNHMVVAALIATVAFTAGFTMPGGYIQSGGENEGMAVLSTKSIAFQAFIISDTTALLFSTSALFMYFVGAIYASLEEEESYGLYVFGGLFCNMLGLGAMIVAFITGTYAVLQHAHALAVATCVIACCTFPTYLYLPIMMKLDK